MIKIIVVGKIRMPEINSLIEYYKKQIKWPLEIIEIASQDLEIGMKIEGQKILNSIKSSDYCMALSIAGNCYSSEQFSVRLEKIISRDVCFIIGGAYGLSDEVYDRADEEISLSKMTFTYQIARLLLIEQLYRAQQILVGHPYHK